MIKAIGRSILTIGDAAEKPLVELSKCLDRQGAKNAFDRVVARGEKAKRDELIARLIALSEPCKLNEDFYDARNWRVLEYHAI